MGKNKISSLLVRLLLITSYLVFSQTSKDFVSFNYSIIPNGTFKDKNIELTVNQFDFNFVTPTINVSSKTKINSIIYYRFSIYSFDTNSPDFIVFPDELHEIKYTLLARQTLNTNLEMIFLPRFSIRSDFMANLNKDDFFPAVSAIFMKKSKRNENLKWGIGLNYNNDLGKNSIIPILAFSYVTDKIRFSTFFPNNANITFLSSKKIEYGFGFSSDPTLTHVNTLNSIKYIRTLNVNINSAFSCKLTSSFWLNAKVGWVLHRKYDLYNSDFKMPNSDFENKIKSSAYFQLGFSFRTNE